MWLLRIQFGFLAHYGFPSIATSNNLSNRSSCYTSPILSVLVESVLPQLSCHAQNFMKVFIYYKSLLCKRFVQEPIFIPLPKSTFYLDFSFRWKWSEWGMKYFIKLEIKVKVSKRFANTIGNKAWYLQHQCSHIIYIHEIPRLTKTILAVLHMWRIDQCYYWVFIWDKCLRTP